MVKYFEDYKIGDKVITPGRTVTEADVSIINGIARYNEPLMIDKEYAKTTRFGDLIVPGRVSLCLSGGLLVLGHVFDDETTICGAGMRNVNWINPLRLGDTIKSEIEFIEKRETSNPTMGLVTHREICKNQIGEVILEVEESHLVQRKPA